MGEKENLREYYTKILKGLIVNQDMIGRISNLTEKDRKNAYKNIEFYKKALNRKLKDANTLHDYWDIVEWVNGVNNDTDFYIENVEHMRQLNNL